jgi:hypothetical protein
MEGDLEVGTSNLFVDTQTGNIGIGTDNPGYTLDVAGGVGIAGDLNIGGETILGTATYRKRRDWDRSALAYVYLGNVRTNDTTGIRLDVSLNNANSGYTMYQFQITLNGNDSDHSGGQLVYSSQGTNNNSIARSIEIGYAYVGTSGIYEYQLWLKDPTTSTVGNMDAYLNCQGYYNFDTGVSDVAHGGSAPTNFNSGIVGVLVDRVGNVGIGTTNPGSLLTFYKDYTVPANGSEPADDTTQGITFRSDLNSFGASLSPAWSSSTSVVDTAKIWFQPKSYQGISGSAGVHGYLAFGTGYFGSQSNTPDMVINTGGNVGIGTASPGSKLDIYTGSTSTVGLSLDRFSSGNYRTDIYQNSYGPDFRVGYGSYTPESILYLKRLSNGSKEVEINGNVGIGTTSPNGNLHIMSDLANASSQINPSAQLVLHSSLAGLDDDGDIGASLVFTQRWLDSSPNSHGTMGSIHGFKDLSAGNYGGGLLFKTQPGSDTAPVERMRIDRDGNVGIGTTSPDSRLVVEVGGTNNTVRTGLILRTPDSDLGTGYNIDFRQSTALVGRITCLTEGAGLIGMAFSTYNGSTTERMRIASNGNVGIGVSSPSSKLHIDPGTNDKESPNTTGVYVYNSGTGDSTCTLRVKDSSAGDPYVSFDVAGEAGWALGMDNSDANKFKLSYSWSSLSSATKLTVDSSGNVGIGNTNPAFPLTIGSSDGNKIQFNESSTPGHNITTSSGWQFNFNAGRSSTDDDAKITFNISGSSGYDEMMRVTHTGVGIGTTSPGAKLDVNGISKNNNPGCRVGQNASQYTLPSSSTNTLKYNYVFYDTGSDYSTSTGLFTCPVAGKYLCIHMMTNRSTRTRSAISETKIFWNGGEVSRQFMDITQDSSVATVIIDAAVNDTLNAGIWNGNANNQYNGINEGGGSQFFVHFLG